MTNIIMAVILLNELKELCRVGLKEFSGFGVRDGVADVAAAGAIPQLGTCTLADELYLFELDDYLPLFPWRHVPLFALF